LTFFGSSSKNVEKVEEEGRPIKEVSKTMWMPFAILAIATIAIGLVGFVFEDQLHHLFSEYLSHSFGIRQEGSANGEPNNDSGFLNLNPIAVISSVAAFGVGGFLGFVFYIQRRASPEKINENVVSRAIWQFLTNRWYLNSIIYWIGVVIPLAFYRRVYKYFENIVMSGVNISSVYSMAFMSRIVKITQTGNIQTYLYVFAAGIIVVSMLLLV
jgi:NADH-quinone oxidoreductase subunit L